MFFPMKTQKTHFFKLKYPPNNVFFKIKGGGGKVGHLGNVSFIPNRHHSLLIPCGCQMETTTRPPKNKMVR